MRNQRHRLYMVGSDEQQLEGVFQHRPYWLSVDACGLHRDLLDTAEGYNRMLWTALRRKAAYLPG